MHRIKLRRLVLTVTLCLSMVIGAAAADPSAMSDIKGHWAQSDIVRAVDEGLFEGVSETEFQPDEGITRGMFVTVLGRMAGIDEDEYDSWYLYSLYSDVSSEIYYAPYVNWATRYGIVNGIGDGEFGPDELLSREQLAVMLIRYASIYNYVISGSSSAAEFSDQEDIAGYAADAVETLRMTGIMTGYAEDDGSYTFRPQNNVTRAECAAVLCRLEDAMEPYTERELIDPESISVMPATVDLSLGETTSMISEVLPADATNLTVTWVSSDPSVAAVDRDGHVTGISFGSADIYGYTWNGLWSKCSVTVSDSLAYDGESYTDKCMRVFGEVVDDPRLYYLDDPGSDSYLVTIPVEVWDFTDSTYTEKYTKTIYLQVHKNLASTVQAIFAEIYNGPEQFPISSAGGYYLGDYSEHSSGLAIDINPDSNYYCDPNGNAITGTHWDPDNDPYSIPLDGDVVRAFAKYGFTRGIYWRSGYKDYMHFSYFAT